ncbi:YjaG family protein [Catenovulum sp. SM1970]|uniref:YjaG family protein n=1 Tax=Marinifaba aquimaris TaxID=2741323 RepID=UPI00157305AB|nr:YjaG family protein [Marinifaba aquimaris]NTS78663.1 YjaG family protein [Marinifaba aquimaris]
MSKPSTFSRIRDLKRTQQIAFSALLLERMLPNYQLYSELTEQGDFKVLRKALDAIWQKLYDPKTKINLELREERVSEQIPEEQTSDSIGLYAAIDAAMALVSLLSLMQRAPDEGQKESVYVSLLSQGTIERLLISSGEAEHSKDALNHPHMQWEIDSQNEFLDRVEKIHKFDAQACKDLQVLALAEGVTNLGIEVNAE